MLRKTSIVGPATLLVLVLATACDHANISAPSLPSPAPIPLPPSEAVEAWNITARLTDARGGECVGETLQSQIGSEKAYSFSITGRGTKSALKASLESASGDYVCTFTGGSSDENGFTFDVGYFWCEVGGKVEDFLCDNGMRRDLEALGHNLSGRVSGNEISGTWSVSYVVMFPGEPLSDIAALDTTTEYKGTRSPDGPTKSRNHQ
jgi:hypothetical protein